MEVEIAVVGGACRTYWTAASFIAKICFSVTVANREAILLTTFAAPAWNGKHYSSNTVLVTNQNVRKAVSSGLVYSENFNYLLCINDLCKN